MVSDKQLCLSMVLVGTDRFLTIIDLSSRAMVDPVISSQNMIDPDRFWQVLTDPHGFWRVLVGPYELRWANIDPDKIALKNCRKPLKICAIRFINFWNVRIGFVWFLLVMMESWSFQWVLMKHSDRSYRVLIAYDWFKYYSVQSN